VDARAIPAAFLVVMGGALVCFVQAFRVRFDRRRHVRWAASGAAIDLAGTVAVLVVTRVAHVHVPVRDAEAASIHRVLAYVATALLAIQIATGVARARVHPWLGPLFLGVFTATYVVAAAAYGPW